MYLCCACARFHQEEKAKAKAKMHRDLLAASMGEVKPLLGAAEDDDWIMAAARQTVCRAEPMHELACRLAAGVPTTGILDTYDVKAVIADLDAKKRIACIAESIQCHQT